MSTSLIRISSIPDFTNAPGKPGSCGLAQSEINERFSGDVGNVLTLDLHGMLTIPPPPTPTTTTLTASPSGSALAGTTVALTAKISGTGSTSPTTGPGGTMEFVNDSTVLATVPATGTTTTYTTSLLPAGRLKLTAIYSGGGGFEGSTSSPLTYTVVPKPSVVLNLPSSVPGGSATPTPFSMTLTNPSNGENYASTFIEFQLSGIRNLTHTTMVLQYQDGAGTWCTLVGFRGTTTNIHGFFVGAGSSCTPDFSTPGASFSLSKGSSLSVNLRLAYPNAGYYGTQKIVATLQSGSCLSARTCTSVPPLTGSAAAVGTGTVKVLPTSPVPTIVSDISTRPASSTVRQTFAVSLVSLVNPVTSGFGLPAPTGKVSYTIDGVHIATTTLPFQQVDQSKTRQTLYDAGGLSLGRHTVVASYSGDDVYQPSSLTEAFTVIAAPTGTPFTCVIGGESAATVRGYVTATGTVPRGTLASTTATSPVTHVSVTLDVDPAAAATFINTSQGAATLGFVSNGATSVSPGAPTRFSGTTKQKPDLIGTWTTTATPSTPTKTPTTRPLTTTIKVSKGTAPGDGGHRG